MTVLSETERRPVSGFGFDSDPPMIPIHDSLTKADADITAPSPAVVLLDINLPRKPGSEILHHLRKSHRCGKALVVVVSSSDSAKDHEEMTTLGANGYFHKPFKYEEFMKLGDRVKDVGRNGNLENCNPHYPRRSSPHS